MKAYGTILEVLAIDVDPKELMVYVLDPMDPVGVVMQWEGYRELTYVIYWGEDYNGEGDTKWYIDDLTNGEDQHEFDSLAAALNKMVELRRA